MVMGGCSRSEGRGFESQCHILDGQDIFTLIRSKNCNDVCLKRLKINGKEAGICPFCFKKIKIILGFERLWDLTMSNLISIVSALKLGTFIPCVLCQSLR